MLDGVVRDVLYACRSFRRTPLVALTIVTTVGLGLGLVARCVARPGARGAPGVGLASCR